MADENTYDTAVELLEAEITATKRNIKKLKEQFKQASSVTIDCSKLITEPEVKSEMLALKSERLKSEISCLEKIKIEGLPNDKVIQKCILKNEMVENLKNIKILHQYMNSKVIEIEYNKERVLENLKMAEELKTALATEHSLLKSKELTSEEEKQNEFETRLYQRYQEVKKMSDYYTEKLMAFIDENYKAPDKKQLDKFNKQHLNGSVKICSSEVLSLGELVQKLINQHLATPNDSYVQIDETIWPPYVGLLLNSNIISRHPDNHNFICLDNVLE